MPRQPDMMPNGRSTGHSGRHAGPGHRDMMNRGPMGGQSPMEYARSHGVETPHVQAANEAAEVAGRKAWLFSEAVFVLQMLVIAGFAYWAWRILKKSNAVTTAKSRSN